MHWKRSSRKTGNEISECITKNCTTMHIHNGAGSAYTNAVKLGHPNIPIPHFETYLLINVFFPFLPLKGRQISPHKMVQKLLYTKWWQSFPLLAGSKFWLFSGSPMPESYFQPRWLTQRASGGARQEGGPPAADRQTDGGTHYLSLCLPSPPPLPQRGWGLSPEWRPLMQTAKVMEFLALKKKKKKIARIFL